MNKTVSIIITLALVIGIAIIFSGGGGKEAKQSVEIRDGVQYITILASGGYSPNKTTAQSGIPTKLIMKTTGSFDCSASLVIRSIGFQKILPQTGETEIDLGTPKKGEPLTGVCGMGMYSFTVDFI
ncbi:hypothetical protein A3H53_03795 [Candidatus Nomurabacteria bacterium RIFCSPLOWO2_02_FULL_40_10]|uniref:EfeO-type cupredoxin-like domain-containing protein n=2 Tax=Candidatus Nomuraibacteriota TaxID=1752729 RepID=A0A1F6XVS3_9BACT|nr:MAG: hypothetical protein A2642_01255 [Candidatus Nomurabacteria bacterium RIFCSPHIGHO2_01_FULL_39_10]OGI98235.1 MAG: hypothetical protein A3H53_03795 [Candidatus Nomurabacteria bacterium RIFCSPLOWO2_02_FULL_40_10]